MRYKYILLDIDGTLIDFDESFKAASRKILEADNTPATDENIEKYYQINDDAWFGLDMENIHNPYIISNYHSLYRQYIINAATESYRIMGLNTAPQILADWYEHQWAACSIANPNAVSVCKELAKNYTLCIATNGLTHIQRNKLTDFDEYMAHYFISEEINHIKPEKEYFIHILNKLGATPGECLMVGDSLHNDIGGANSVGIDSCYYNPLGKINNSDIIPTHEINDFNKLLEIVK
jgi:HAD superfamily hydrolase (TIGR01549 family)